MSGDKPFDPSDMTDHRSERDAREFVDDRASATAEGTPSGPGGSKSRTPVLIGVIAAVVLIGGAIIGVLAFGGSNTDTGEAVTQSTPAPEPVVEESAEEPAPEPEPVVEETAEEPPAEPVVEETIEPVISKVNQTVAISYPSRVTALTNADKQAILELANQPLAEDEQVVVSGFAGRSATEEFGRQISLERAQVIQQFLADNGVQADIVGYGTTPVADVLGSSQQEAIVEGLDTGRVKKEAAEDNRLAFVSAVVVEQQS